MHHKISSMRNQPVTFGTLVVLLGVFASVISGSEPESRVPVVVELFTSEGCSSCPPADRLLAKLIEKQPIENVEIIGLEQHVDYWDRLGWRDPFSSAQFTKRQSVYGRVFRLRSIYTPQMVVDGTHQFVGSERGDALDAIAASARQPKAQVDAALSLSAPEGRDRRLTVRVEIADVPEAVGSERLQVVLAIIEDGLESKVSQGENRGKVLRHRGVTRHFAAIGTMNPEQTARFSKETEVVLDPSWRPAELKAVVLVQAFPSRQIIGAASVPIADSL